jgi:uncharacterized membrane protein
MNHKKSDPPYTPAFVTVKLMDIGITYTYFFVIGLLVAKVFDYIYSDILDESKTDWKTYPISLFTLNILFHFFLIGVTVYLIRNVVGAIPYPLDGMAGYQHYRLKELGGGAVLVFMIFLFQKNLTDKIKIYAERVIGVTETAKSSEIEASEEAEEEEE